MNKIAFVVPVYPPHYSFAYSLIKSYKKFFINLQADIYFVFTSQEDRKLFKYAGGGGFFI